MKPKIITIVSGAASGALNIAVSVAEDINQSWDSTIILRKYNKAGIQGARTIKDRLVADYIWNLYILLKEERPDLVMVHGYSTHLWTKIVTALLGIKLIHVEHNVERYTPFRRWLLNKLDKYTAGYICVSNGIAQYLSQLGVPASKLTVIYNGIDINEFSSPKDKQNIYTIGMTARFSRQKDQLALIKAVEHLVKGQDQALKLILLGDGKTKRNCMKYVEKHALGSIVDFRKGRFRDLAPKLDLFVLSTNWEGFGLVVVEAMAARIPVVASNVPGVNEIINHGENGFLVDGGDDKQLATAIWSCIKAQQQGQLQNIVDQAYRDVCSRFCVDGMHEEYKKYIGRLLVKKDMADK
ncbi:glycosyltransferase [Sporomusa sphaeroides]|uniref:glycosyltransferase n=1 Tax=Sporomusa sphaeroides TaxID=47679 RepID=UPI003DA17E6D